MNIRLARIDDLDRINELYKRIIEDIHNNKKINMWNDIYPFCEFEKNIKDKDMYVLEDGKKIIGSFALTDFDYPEYHVINWKYKNKKFFYINRLVIDVDCQGKGYSKNAMDYIENYAIENNYEVVRLMLHIDNKIAMSLYEKYGFEKIEDSSWIIDDKRLIGYEKEVK